MSSATSLLPSKPAMALLYTDSRFLDHDTGRGHPESPARLKSIDAMLEATKIGERFARGDIVPARDEQLELVHAPAYLRHLREFIAAGGSQIESDTRVCAESFDVARLAAGAALAAVDQVLGGEHRQAVCLVRPPGHHATRDQAMGFCLFNNVALAAAWARQHHGLGRVLIVDWDVHHGNGTQDIFYSSPDVYFFSAHRYPFYPGTGAAEETGAGAGKGTTFNLPLRFGIRPEEYRARFETMLHDAADRCRPELILISAGFDAHQADPIGSLGLDDEDFAWLTRLVADAARAHCGGKLVSLLEGGYDLVALAGSVQAHLEELLRGGEGELRARGERGPVGRG